MTDYIAQLAGVQVHCTNQGQVGLDLFYDIRLVNCHWTVTPVLKHVGEEINGCKFHTCK